MSLLLVRPGFNNVETALSSTVSPAADALFPVTNAYDRIPASIFKFGSLAADSYVWFDFDKCDDKGEFETWAAGAADGWTEANTGGSDVTQTSVGAEVHSGVSAAKLTCAGAGVALAYHEFTAKAGARLRVDLWARGDAGTGTLLYGLYNVNTGKNGIGGATWSTGALGANFLGGSSSSATYQHLTTDVTVESFATCRSDTVKLRVFILNSTNGTSAFADSVTILPVVNFASVHGHNIDPCVTLKLRSSSVASAGSFADRATFSVVQPACYASISDQYIRYWQIMCSGTNSSTTGAPYFGEIVIGDALTLATGPRYPMSVGYRDPRIEVPMRWGSQAYAVGQHASRTFPISLQAVSMTARLEIFDELFRRSRGGAPVVIVPHNADSHTDVIYGRVSPDLPHEWGTKSVAGISTSVEELPFPFVTS